MNRMQKNIIVAATVVMAVLLHGHYIRYGVADKGHVLQLWPSAGAEAKLIREEKKNAVLRKEWWEFSELSRSQLLGQLDEIQSKYGLIDSAEAAEAAADAVELTDAEARQAHAKMYGDKAQTSQLAKDAELKNLMSKPEQKRKMALAAIDSQPIYFGLLATNIDKAAPRKSINEAFWLGVVVPISLVVIALLLAAQRRSMQQAGVVLPDEMEPPSPAGATSQVVQKDQLVDSPSLAELLLADFGPGFPIQSGDGSETDPLIVTAIKDYVAVEYAIVRHVLGSAGEEFQLSKQALMTMGNRKIDKMIFDVKPVGAEEWQGSRSFYFDITAGYDGLFTS